MAASRKDDPRKARLAEALRANLRRRKAQAKAREAATEEPIRPEPAVKLPQEPEKDRLKRS